jgi:hypothetical protein
MSQIVYCVCERISPVPEGIEGICERPVNLVEGSGLAAAVSVLPEGEHHRQVQEVVRYARVVEAFSRQGTVIPMRYGCCLSTEGAIKEFLGQRQELYRQTLERLRDCVEMGVRVLPRRQIGACKTEHPPQPRFARSDPSGVAYLAARWAEFKDRDLATQECARMADRLRAGLGGLFRESVVEAGSLGGQSVVSAFFLVPREQIDRFREAFASLCSSHQASVLLTGPWPPYNFVQTAAPRDNLGMGVVNGSARS